MAEIRPLRLSDIVTEDPQRSLRPADFPVEGEEERAARDANARDLLQKEVDQARASGDPALAENTERELKRIPAPAGAKTAPDKNPVSTGSKVPKWTAIEESPKFQALDAAGRESVRMDYWQNYVSPHFETDELEDARKEFDELTKPSLTRSLKKGAKELVDKVAAQRDPRTWEEPQAGVEQLNEERRAEQPARATASPKGQVKIAPADLSLKEPPERTANWIGEDGVLTNAPAGMVAAGKNAVANLRRAMEEETVTQRGEALATQGEQDIHAVRPGQDVLQHGESPTFRRHARAAPQRHRAALEEATKAGEAAKLWAGQTRKELELVTPADMSTEQQAVWSFIQSTPPTMLGISIGILTRNPMAAMAIAGGGGGAQQVGATYGEAREHGASHRLAGMAASIDGILEGVGEAIPLATALKPGSPFLTRLGKVVAQEAGQEGITQLAQDLNAYLTYNPKITLQEAWQNFKVATLAGAIGGTVYGSIGQAVQPGAAKAQPAPAGAAQEPAEQAAQAGVDLSDPAGLSRAVAGEQAPAAQAEPGSEAIDAGAVLGNEEDVADGGSQEQPPVAAAAPAPAPAASAQSTAAAQAAPKEPAKPAEAVKPKKEAGEAAPPAVRSEQEIQEEVERRAMASKENIVDLDKIEDEVRAEKPAAPRGGETVPPPPRGSRQPAEEAAGPEQQLEGAAAGLKQIFESPVDEKAHEAATSSTNDRKEPTEPQKEAGNYKKGHVRLGGLDLSIENPAGSKRRPEWPDLNAHYGYIRGTVGKDKDHIDVFVKPGTPEEMSNGSMVFVIDQKKPSNGHFDEHKIMLGYDSMEEAESAYKANYTKDWDGIRNIVEMPLHDFKRWLREGDTKQPVVNTLPQSKAEVLSLPMLGRGKGWRGVDSGKIELQQYGSGKWAYGLNLHTNIAGIAFAPHWGEARYATRDEAHAAAVERGLQWAGPKNVGAASEESNRAHAEKHLPYIRKWLEGLKGGPKPEGKPPSGWKELGANAQGEMLFEDARGVRSIVRNGIRVTESVGLRPTRGAGGGVEYQPEVEHKGEYLTKEETDAAQAGKQQGDGEQQRGRDGEQLQGKRPDREQPPAKPAARPEDRGGRSDEQGGETSAAERPEAAPAGEPLTTEQVKALAEKFSALLGGHTGFGRSINEARALAAEFLKRPVKAGTIAAKQVDEALELGVVLAARQIIARMRARGATDKEIYVALRELYGRQPNLNVRTSTSIEQQAYSTPVPLAFIASRLAEINGKTRVLEPTAGNGMLLIEADPDQAVANELNPDRESALKAQGFITTRIDATALPSMEPVDAVIANPPFGYMKDDAGRNREWKIDERYTTNQVDHAIAFKALEALKDDGRAVLIVGAPREGKVDGYESGAKRAFYFTLYRDYNVVDHFTVQGDLYAKQGAAWPVDVIVIHGRGKSKLRLPQAVKPKEYGSWADLEEKLDGRQARPGEVGEQGAGAADAGAGERSPDASGVRPGPARAGATQPAPVERPAEPSPARPARVEPPAAGLDQGAPDRPGERPAGGELRGTDRPADAGGDRQPDVAPGVAQRMSKKDVLNMIADAEGREPAFPAPARRPGEALERQDVGQVFDEEFSKLFGDLEKAPRRGEAEEDEALSQAEVKAMWDEAGRAGAATKGKFSFQTHDERFGYLNKPAEGVLSGNFPGNNFRVGRDADNYYLIEKVGDQLVVHADAPRFKDDLERYADDVLSPFDEHWRKLADAVRHDKPRAEPRSEKDRIESEKTYAANELREHANRVEKDGLPNLADALRGLASSMHGHRPIGPAWVRDHVLDRMDKLEEKAKKDPYGYFLINVPHREKVSEKKQRLKNEERKVALAAVMGELGNVEEAIKKASLEGKPTEKLARKRERLATRANKLGGKVELVKSAAAEVAAGMEETAKALTELFAAPGKVGAGLSFDEATYAKAKPHFIAGVQHFKQAAADIREMVRLLLTELRTKFAMTAEAIMRMKPYVVRFVEDVMAGKIPELAAATAARPQEQETEFQRGYEPKSKVGALGSLAPAGLRESMHEALVGLEEREGDIDAFVAKELGYTPEELGRYFKAEQVDALGLAISSIKRGSAFIIGDQTGIGKGRVNAAVIRWAIKNDKTPVFVTEKPNLYGDMLRDLNDIGMPKVRPVITNNNANVPADDEAALYYSHHEAEVTAAKAKGEKAPRMPDVEDRPGRWLKTGQQGKLLEELTSKGSLGDYDVIFTTYNQMQSVDGKLFPRHTFLTEFSKGGVMIMDESHNAGGTAKDEDQKRGKKDDGFQRSKYARALLANAFAAFYSSATYAKRPSVMDLYFRTDMGLASLSITQIVKAMEHGGVPLQQVVASMLTKAGQYIRREKSFAGIDYVQQLVKVNRPVAERVASVMKDITEFDHLKGHAVDAIDTSIKDNAGTIREDGSIGEAGATSTNFTSLMHNVVNQMLLALKAAEIADIVLASLKAGEKPVLTVANTMGSFIGNYAEDFDVNHGDAVDISFQDLLLRYLERSRDVLEGDAYGKKARRRLSDDELGPTAVALWEQIKKTIKESPVLREIPLSPIDHIKNLIEKAGYKFGEITGRQHALDYSGDRPIYRVRAAGERSIGGRKGTIVGFNSGEIDVLLINQAGSTGISLHAGEKFKDQRRRHMVVIQAEGNVDTHMQVLGRVNRTGQVSKDGKAPKGKAAAFGLPHYTQLDADVPAEKRPGAVLLKKMALLNANTTGARGSAVVSKEVVDFMNQYGDEVAVRLVTDNPDWNKLLDYPIKEDPEGDGLKKEGAVHRLTGRIPMLPLAKQEELYDLIESEYLELIEEKDRMGENALEARTLDLKAKVLKTIPVFEGKAVASPFAHGAVAEVVDVKKLGRSYTANELVDLMGKELGLTDAGGPVRHRIQQEGRKKSEADIERMEGEFEVFARGAIDSAKAEQQGAMKTKLEGMRDRLTAALAAAPTGRMVMLRTRFGEIPGTLIRVARKGKPENPAALGSWKFTFAVADAIRHFTVPATRLFTPRNAQASAIDTGGIIIDDYVRPAKMQGKAIYAEFDDAQSVTREERVIMTGNLLAAFGKFPRGRITSYTTHDGKIQLGILMPQKFDIDKALHEAPVEFPDARSALDFLDRMQGRAVIESSEEKLFRVAKVGNYGQTYRIAVAAAKGTGGSIYLDPDVLKAAGTDFVKAGASMRVDIEREEAIATLQKILDMGHKAHTTAFRDEATNFLKGRQPKTKFADGWESIDTAADGDKNPYRVRYPKRPRANEELQRALDAVAANIASTGRQFPAGSLRPVWPADPGALRGLSDTALDRGRDLALASRVASFFGQELVYIENTRPDVVNFGGLVTDHAPGKIFFNFDAPRPATFIVGHELVHVMEREAPDVFKRFSDAVSPLIPSTQGYERSLPGDLKKEVMADFVGWNFMEPEFWAEVGKQQPSFFRRIADFVASWLNRILGTFKASTPRADMFLTDVKAARQAVIDALTQWQARGSTQRAGGTVSFAESGGRESMARDISLTDKVLSAPFKLAKWDRMAQAAWGKVAELNERITDRSEIYEAIRAGVESDYGLEEAYVDRRVEMQVNLQKWARGAVTMLDKLGALSREESRVAYEWLNERDADHLIRALPDQSKQTLRELKELIRALGEEGVELGQLSREVFERNELAYLHRSYLRHELEQTILQRLGHRKAVALWGDQYKGRGLKDWRSQQEFNGWAGEMIDPRTMKGRKFHRLELRAAVKEDVTGDLAALGGRKPRGRLRKVVYVPDGKPIPKQYADWQNDGLWEVRWFHGGKWGLWRDLTKDERRALGEIDEVRFAVAKTLHLMTHDIEVGRMQKWIAQTYSRRNLPAGAREVTAHESLASSFGRNTWVKVPMSEIPKSNVRKYGPLAGLYVPGPIWNDIRQRVAIGEKPGALRKLWDDMLRMWKVSKTALSPGVHTNNVMANMFIADFHDLRAKDLLKGLRVMLDVKFSKAPAQENADIYRRFEDSGALHGMFKYAELKREALDPLLEDIRREALNNEELALTRVLSVISWLNGFETATKKVADGMIAAYGAEDEVFRLAMFIKGVRHGVADLEAGKLSRKAFLDYDINAPWIQALRRSVFPFIAFPYRALPMMVHTFTHKPWKLAKYVGVAYALNALAYAWLGLDDEDEDRERRLMPEEKAGRIWGLFPKMIRMPWNSAGGDPVFLDVRRWFPAGDIFDVGGTHSAIPWSPTALPGGPVALLAELFANKSQFTGQDITQTTDTGLEVAKKVGAHIFRFAAPNLFMIPGTWSFEGIRGAVGLSEAGKVTDVFGREMSVPQAFASALGVKVGTYPEDVMRYNLQRKTQREVNEILGNIYKATGDVQRNKMSKEKFAEYTREQMAKIKKLQQEAAERLQPARP